MFEFGIAKKRIVPTSTIMLDDVPNKYYINAERLNRFLHEESTKEDSNLRRLGFILSKEEYEKGERIWSHQSNRVYSSDSGAPTVSAINIIAKMTCPPKEGQATIEVNGNTYSVRHLTPKECWRLQGIRDDCYDRVEPLLNEVKLYERAGRAICVPMLESIFSEFFKNENIEKLRVFEAFSGIGSQRMALDNIGIPYESVGIMEVDRYGLIAYDAIHNKDGADWSIGKSDEEMLEELRSIHVAYNFSNMSDEMPTKHDDIVRLYNASKRSHNFGDILRCDEMSLPNMDFFTYSFPCKNITVAGDMQGFKKDSGTQSSLVWECERIIKEKRPRYLMMENVKDICNNDNMPTFNIWIDILKSLGYKSHWRIYNSIDYGVPQSRDRVIMMSKLVR